MSINTIRRVAVGFAAAGAAVALGATPAFAHVSPVESEAAAGSYTIVDLKVPHGCDGKPTEKIEVQVPEGINSVTPRYIPGWTVTKTSEDLEKPVVDGHGNEITSRDSLVTWTANDGNALPDGQLLVVGLSLQVPDKVGERLYFKTIQTCGDATADWINEWDGTGDEPDSPAPAVLITEGTGGDGHGHGSEATTEDDSHKTDTDKAESSDKDDDGTDPLAIGGLVAGLAGLGLGGAAFARSGRNSK